MQRLLEDVLARETPVPPPEVAHLVQNAQVRRGGLRVGERVVLQVERARAVVDVLEELAVVPGPVRSEVLQDGSQRCGRHRDLEQIVAERDHAVVGAGLAAEREGLARDAFIDDAVGEHGLRGDAENECAEGGVLGRLGLAPHLVHDFVDHGHCSHDFLESLDEGSAVVRSAGVESAHHPGDERTRVADHVDVD
ncbi:unnamed protein product [Mycena citricolor]|uniref:Uncharacterized protein n=1 Tax=Mycena citricolor TaxID=2018698 RepID=A0AAD2GYM7_9AGAR|nr:unnamed protein product [Mycena citricolor]